MNEWNPVVEYYMGECLVPYNGVFKAVNEHWVLFSGVHQGVL